MKFKTGDKVIVKVKILYRKNAITNSPSYNEPTRYYVEFLTWHNFTYFYREDFNVIPKKGKRVKLIGKIIDIHKKGYWVEFKSKRIEHFYKEELTKTK